MMASFGNRITALPDVYIHPLAFVETEKIGRGTDINPFTHIMPLAIIGDNCNICAFATIDEGAILEDNVTVMNNAYIARGVHLKSGVFIGPNAVITNDLYPRSPRSSQFAPRYERERRWLVKTVVGEHASLGANVTLVAGNDIGVYAMVGAGSVVTQPVPPYALVRGNPARFAHWIDEHGEPIDAPPANRIEKE